MVRLKKLLNNRATGSGCDEDLSVFFAAFECLKFVYMGQVDGKSISRYMLRQRMKGGQQAQIYSSFEKIPGIIFLPKDS